MGEHCLTKGRIAAPELGFLEGKSGFPPKRFFFLPIGGH
jgi:hypothetical protein